MPEERTVSRFTRLNSNDRANQDARTIVAMTKIYQHNRREDRETSVWLQLRYSCILNLSRMRPH
jgi:hypothetical protein